MAQESNSERPLGKITCEIPLKLPTCNEYINECRRHKYAGARMKKEIQRDINFFISHLPRFEKPVKIHFHWIDMRWRADPDNACFAKKFILDALVNAGVLADDNRKCVTAFTDTFEYGQNTKVILEIEEVQE